jgi:uncharacterized protein YegP (UPF0339 family)
MRADRWEFAKDLRGRWRWRRIAPNGRIVASSSQGYRWLSSCRRNARRNGWTPEGWNGPSSPAV